MINVEVLRIMLAKGSGDGVLKRIYRYIDTGLPYSLEDICNSTQTMCSMGIKLEVAENICKSKDCALELQEQLYKHKIDMYWIGDINYPRRLKALDASDIPALIFFTGNSDLLKTKSVGFTGSRNVSDIGIKITRSSAEQLAENNVAVVSGYAKGVDIMAHRTALQSGGNTVFVISEGIFFNNIKSEVKELLNERNHVFVSQFMPTIPWSASNAMKRNNTIIGLSDAMILIESNVSGGTFNAGQQSLKYKKPLFVVDYMYKRATAEGNPFFLQHGGIPLKSDRTGKPALKKLYSAIDNKTEEKSYEQMCLKLV